MTYDDSYASSEDWYIVSDLDDANFDIDDDDGHPDTWLRIGNEVPIAAGILDYFTDLPPCKSAMVHPLSFLSKRRSWTLYRKHDPSRRIFDELYMEDLCRALELWLEGKREGVELPDDSNEFWQPYLERLAYTAHKGDFYCDGGLVGTWEEE